MHPEEVSTDSLQPGQVGFIACNIKESSEGRTALITSNYSLIELSTAHIGDTLHRFGAPVEPMPGFKAAKAMVRSLLVGN